MKVRKIPRVVDAFLWTGDLNANTDPAWVTEARLSGLFTVETWAETAPLLIETLEGTMKAQVGDWLIRGVKGELYPCKPDIFAETYEKVEE